LQIQNATIDDLTVRMIPGDRAQGVAVLNDFAAFAGNCLEYAVERVPFTGIVLGRL
jgi:hypothetical protein